MYDKQVQLERAFYEELKRLNRRQAEAVHHIEGPVVVVAGPGTGKTHILAARIGHILMETDTRPQDILCLTYTEAATVAMRNRLTQLIGSAAFKVPVYTFHAFCNRIIQDNAELFGDQKAESPAGELVRLQLLVGLIEQLPVNSLLISRHGSPELYVRDILGLFERMKKDRLQPEVLIEWAQREIENPADDPTMYVGRSNLKTGQQKGTLSADKIAAARIKLNRFIEAVQLFEPYQRLLAQRGYYDFDDMILWVVQAFEQHPALLRRYQEQFLYVLVDEFQDTNGAQNALVTALMDYWDSPNLFVVGDDDQSIFEFQGARLKNVVEIYQRYADTRLVVLTQNYRSTQPILDAAAVLIDHNQLRLVRVLPELGLDKKLTAHTTGTLLPVCRVYPDLASELAAALATIEETAKSGVPYSNIAVIVHRHKDYEPLRRLLERSDIPVFSRQPSDALHTGIGRLVMDLLNHVVLNALNPTVAQDDLLSVLRLPWWGIELYELAALAAYNNTHRGSTPWLTALSNRPDELQISDETADKLLRIIKLINEWALWATAMPLVSLLEIIFRESGLLAWADAHDDRLIHLPVISAIHKYAFEQMQAGAYDLVRMVRDLQDMVAFGIKLPVHSLNNNPAGVQLLTAHGAKGLEFDTVLIIHAQADKWEAGQGRTPLITYPKAVLADREEDTLESRRRLFYVAMTRAQRQLILSYSRTKDDLKETSPSQFIGELHGYIKTEIMPAAEKNNLYRHMLLNVQAKPTVRQVPVALIERQLGKLKLSPTVIEAFLRCPLQFYYQYIIGLRGAESPNYFYGLALHKAIELTTRQCIRTGKKHPTGVLDYFRDALSVFKPHLSASEFDRQMARAEHYLPHFIEQHDFCKLPVAAVEWRADLLHLDDIPLTGVIDRIDRMEGGQLIIYDYKTGIVKDQSVKPKNRTGAAARYWRQMQFYALLLELSPEWPGAQPETGIVLAIEQSPKGQFEQKTIAFTPRSLEALKEIIRTVWQRIRQHDFVTGCGQDDCAWCHLSRLVSDHTDLDDMPPLTLSPF